MQPASPTPSHIKGVLFDFDGTLADSFPAITASVNHVRSLHGLAPLSVVEVKRFVGLGPDHLLIHTVGVGDASANLAAYRAHHPSVLQSGTTLLPGAAETLRTLRARGYKLAVCSNKLVPFTRTLNHMLGIEPFFDAVLGPEDVPRPKPAPDMLLAALTRLGVGAAEALYVGDMTVDIDAARAAGLSVWVVPTGSNDIETLKQGKPDRILRGLSQIVELLPELVH